MSQHLSLVSILVDDYDQAIEFYTQKLGFELTEDTPQGDKRWVVVAPRGSHESAILLAKANKPQQQALVGEQGAGRVWLFLQTDDFWTDYQRMLDAKVQFLEQPREESYATVVVFQDLYGNKWDLLQRK
ncbi:MAG: VOC family protein [Gammaproteobacteria bacterium]|jgi:catechol 2,3-dioxygenase-like lactoylglutathione lyase family enzyme|nr:VOC family protein [Gammaproteobacteria bacterium]MBU2278898.1 VOC family protein [Gammaproteobacteria bacterium]MBU2428096.1 VOC family protein [Gammaproteobacteria bacterium]